MPERRRILSDGYTPPTPTNRGSILTNSLSNIPTVWRTGRKRYSTVSKRRGSPAKSARTKSGRCESCCRERQKICLVSRPPGSSASGVRIICGGCGTRSEKTTLCQPTYTATSRRLISTRLLYPSLPVKEEKSRPTSRPTPTNVPTARNPWAPCACAPTT